MNAGDKKTSGKADHTAPRRDPREGGDAASDPGVDTDIAPTTGNDSPKIQPSVREVTQRQVQADAQHRADEQASADKQREVNDRFAGLHGEFLNAVDALGSSHELAMAKSHARQAMEWVALHLRPASEVPVPPAPHPAPPAHR